MTKIQVIRVMVNAGLNVARVTEKVNKYFNEVIEEYKSEDLTIRRVASIIMSKH